MVETGILLNPVTEAGTPSINENLKQIHSMATFNPLGTASTDPSVIHRHRVDTTVKHDLYLKDEQKEIKRIMNREEAARRQ